MNSDILKLATELRSLIGQSRHVTDTTSFNEVFIIAEQIIGTLAFLISPLMLMESHYRQKVVEFLNEGYSHAESESRAKAATEYSEWKKYLMLYELANEQILLLKKFKDKLSDEYQRS